MHLLTFLAPIAFVALAAPGSQEPPERLALLVGIDRYASCDERATVPGLNGCVNDATRASRLLRKRFGFRPDEVLVLLDEKATHAAIVRAFDEHLLQRAGPKTEVVFWFSGHGSRTLDASAVEFQDRDSTLVCFDSRGAPDSIDLTDDELHSLLRALCDKTQRVTVITDSCHSGGVTRGPAAARVRYAEESTVPVTMEAVAEFWPEGVALLDDGDPGRDASLPLVHIAACDADESAFEVDVPIGNGRRRSAGALSYYLTEELERLPPHWSFQQLVRKVALLVARPCPNQNVHVEGTVRRRVFGGDFAPALPGFAGTAWPGQKWVEIEAGTLHLLKRRSVLVIRDLEGLVLGRAKVSRIWPEESEAVWLGEPPDLAAPRAIQAVEIERPRGGSPLTLLVAEGELGDAVAELLAEHPEEVTIAREPVDGHGYQLFASEVSGRWILATASEGLALEEEPATGAGLPLGERAAQLARMARAELRDEARFQRLWSLARVESEFAVDAAFRSIGEEEARALRARHRLPIRPAELEEKTSGAVLLRDDPDADDVLELVLSLPSGAPSSYLSVLCVSEDRSVSVIYPATYGATDSRLEPDKPIHVKIRAFPNPSWSLERPMRDRYIVVATERPIDLLPLTSDSTFRGESAETAAVPPILLEALQPHTLRGGGFRPSAAGLGLATIDLLISREG